MIDRRPSVLFIFAALVVSLGWPGLLGVPRLARAQDAAPAPAEKDTRDPFAGPRVPAEEPTAKPAAADPAAPAAADANQPSATKPSDPPAAPAASEPAAAKPNAEGAAGSTADTAAKEANKDADKKAGQDASQDGAKDANKEAAKQADEDDEPYEIAEVRLVALGGTYVDLVQPAGLDASTLLLSGAPPKQKSFFKLCEYIDELAKDDALKYVVFDLSDADLEVNPAQLDELARHMKKITAAKKKSYAWLENASATHMAIAANCSHVVMADFGGIDMPSAAMASMFYRDAMDLIGVKASVVRAGDFKGAVEPYINPVMSEHLRAHYAELLKYLNDARVSLIAEGRGLKIEQVRQIQAKRMLLPKEAFAAGLVDELAPFGSMKRTISDSIEEIDHWTTRKAKAKKEMTFFELMSLMMQGPSRSSSRIREDSIAVLQLSGPIVDGTSRSSGSIVAGPTVKVIRELIDEDKIKGVVVRINSPGGSATASEAIRQALEELAKEKPTVVSMGQVAASGGYWISCIDAPIYAERGTITGSIGVFSMKLSIGSLLRRIGVHVESITLDDSAAVFAIDRAWSDEDVTTLQHTIDQVYDRFLSLVAENRGMEKAKVGELAGGRVWSGTQAKANGLVDVIGGLDDSLAAVAKKAHLDDYKVIYRPEGSSGLNLSELFGQQDDDDVLESVLPKDAMRLLARRGLVLDTTVMLLRDALETQGRRPTIWLLGPAEIAVR